MYISKQFPIKSRPSNPEVGSLWYFPFEKHPCQFICRGKWAFLESERKRLKAYGYKYENFKKKYI